MNRKELISKISNQSSVSKKNTGLILDELFNLIKSELSSSNSVRFLGFGRFSVNVVKPRNRFNIQLRKVYVSPQHRKISFKPYFDIASSDQKEEDPIIEVPIVDYHFNDTGKGSFNDLLNHSSKGNVGKYNKNFISRPSFRLTRQSGNIVLPNQLNKGVRLENSCAEENTIFEYVGTVSSSFNGAPNFDLQFYSSFYWPFKGTKILNYNKFGGITGGVSEPILFHALDCLKSIESEIEVLQNITLPIRNRNYGYKPDIAIIWKSKNIYLDIEIDEPYDLLSRKPIHYIGCSDNLRDVYFTHNGWFVLRIAEEQVVRNLQDVLDSIFWILYIFSNDSKFEGKKYNKQPVNRWSREEAQLMSKEGYRESYLGIDKIAIPESDQNDIEEDYSCLENFEFIRPSDDIIEDRYSMERRRLSSIKSSGYTHVKIIRKDNYEFLAFKEDVEIEKRNYQYGLKFFDEIELETFFLCFEEIRVFCGIVDPFKRINGTDWNKIIANAVINCNPITMSYNSSNSGLWRNVYYLTPWYTDYDKVEYQDIDKKAAIELIKNHYHFIFGTIEINRNKLEHFCGICTYRETIRTFKSERIDECKVFDIYKPARQLGNDVLWYLLEEGYPKMVELIYKHMPKVSDNDLASSGNLCNAYIMEGNVSSAMAIYKKYDPNVIVEGMNISWKDACLADINHFIEKDIKKENFIEAKTLLSQIWK